MARTRKDRADSWLPTRVYRGKSSYEYRPKHGKTLSLCRLLREGNEIIEPPEQKRKVLEAYDKAVSVSKAPQNVDYWLTRFLVSSRYLKKIKSQHTRNDYLRYIEIKAKPDDKTSRNGIRHVFGQMMPQAVKTQHIRKYMDYWAAAGKESTANKHHACLSTFFKWLREQGAVDTNPASQMTKFDETPRRVYVDDAAYDKIWEAAVQSSTPYVAAAMEVAYLCGLRRNEVVALNIEDITEAGLVCKRSKGSKGEITEISPRLRAALDFAIQQHHLPKRNKARPEPLKDRPLFRSTRGGMRITGSGLYTAFKRIIRRNALPDIWVHDLKKKAGSEGKDLGHKTARMAELYNLKLEVKKATK